MEDFQESPRKYPHLKNNGDLFMVHYVEEVKVKGDTESDRSSNSELKIEENGADNDVKM